MNSRDETNIVVNYQSIQILGLNAIAKQVPTNHVCWDVQSKRMAEEITHWAENNLWNVAQSICLS